MAKTILSPITHARNFLSAGAFSVANGLIPGITITPRMIEISLEKFTSSRTWAQEQNQNSIQKTWQD